jgi:hypothetical protein
MMRTKKIANLAFAIFLSIANFTALLADEVQTTPEGIQYANGGIGEEEADTLSQMATDYSLNLILSQGDGGKIVNVEVTIYDAQGKSVFTLSNAGPQLLVNLPPGRYRIMATYKGVKQSNTFTLDGRKTNRVIMNWKASKPEDAKEE